jgi:hypothetical protein
MAASSFVSPCNTLFGPGCMLMEGCCQVRSRLMVLTWLQGVKLLDLATREDQQAATGSSGYEGVDMTLCNSSQFKTGLWH